MTTQEPPPSAELIARIEHIGSSHEKQRTKAQRLITDFQRLLATVEKRLRVLPAESQERRYLHLNVSLLKAEIAQLQIHDLDLRELIPHMPKVELASELAGHVVAFHDVQVKLMECEAIAGFVTRDLDRAIAGLPPKGHFPAAWLALRPLLASPKANKTDPRLGQVPAETSDGPPTEELPVESLRRFLTDFEAFKLKVPAALEAYELVDPALEPKERLKALKVVNLPALLGLHYRLEALLRPFPNSTGTAILQAVKAKMPTLASLDKPAGQHPPRNTEELVERSPKKGVTDRLSTIFKPKN